MLATQVCQKARKSRDPRFDGQFFVAVKTTKIYCRTICPAPLPKEENVEYFATAIQAGQAGYRPCLRCRPDSAPGSPPWNGVNTTVTRALKLIDEGALQFGSIKDLAERLGISDRYLRKLFMEKLGVAPKVYALYLQCLFAKKLLHQTQLPITEIALASGFGSLRRFNDYFKSQLRLTPSQLRKTLNGSGAAAQICITLNYRPPYNWPAMQQFLAARIVAGLEWCDEYSYGRLIEYEGVKGKFTAQFVPKNNHFVLTVDLDDIRVLKPVVMNIRRVLDLDVDTCQVEADLRRALGNEWRGNMVSGLRLPGIWSVFEAGVRAVLGQQISVTAAKKLVTCLFTELGEKTSKGQYFPTPEMIVNSDLAFLRIPERRKQTLRNLAAYMSGEGAEKADPATWLAIKGIGPWTINYTKMRGLSDPDIFLATDLGVIKALEKHQHFNCEQASPWRSYLTFQLWNLLS